MFKEQQATVVTEEDVGDFIDQLKNSAMAEIDLDLTCGVEDGLDNTSRTTSHRPQREGEV